jgi:hypothetical protein
VGDDLSILSVGHPYLKGKTAWPQAMTYQYERSGHILRIFLRTPSPEEVEAIWQGPAHFGLFTEGHVIFLCFRFYTQANALTYYGEAPFSIHLVPEDYHKSPDLDFPPGVGAALSIILVNAENGLVEALRVLALGHKFSKRLHRAIREQERRPFNQAAYEQQLKRLFGRYTSEQLWRACEIVCKAGEKD